MSSQAQARMLANPDARAARSKLAGQALNESALMHLAGYATALAGVALNKPTARQLANLGLRTAEFSILVLVNSNGEVNQKALGETLAISPPNLAVAIDRMVEQGWVRRERSERDRRQQLIRLTVLGQQLTQQAMQATAHAEQTVMSVLSQAERALLIELLHRVIRGERKRRREKGKSLARQTTQTAESQT